MPKSSGQADAAGAPAKNPESDRIGALELAHAFKYVLQEHDPRVKVRRTYENVKYTNFFSVHRKAFLKLCSIFSKYGIDPEGFFRYAIPEKRANVPEALLDASLFRRYAEHLRKNEEYARIAKAYAKSVEYVAARCLEEGVGPRQFLANEFARNRIAYDFMAGKISKYFLASIGGVDRAYSRLDEMNRGELSIIYDAKDELRTMANEAVFKAEGRYPRPMGDAEAALERLITENNKEMQ